MSAALLVAAENAQDEGLEAIIVQPIGAQKHSPDNVGSEGLFPASSGSNVDGKHHTHPIRVIIDATSTADNKTQSRWTRALRYAWRERRAWINPQTFLQENRSNSAKAPSTARINLPYGLVVSIIESASDLKSALLSETEASTLSKSLVDLAKRSSRVNSNTSPALSAAIALTTAYGSSELR